MVDYNNDLKKKLNKQITLPESVEGQVQAAYQKVREKSASEIQGKKKVSTRSISRWVAAAATIVVMSTTAVAVLAATGFFSKNVVEEGDTVTYEFDVNYELVPGTFEVTPSYLPEGFEEFEEQKYWPEDNWGHGISILPIMNTVELENQGSQMSKEGIENIEKTTLSEMEAHVITLQEEDKYRKGKYIYLFNAEEGYVLEIYGDYTLPMEELKKFADNLTVTRTGDAEYESAEEKASLDEEERRQQEWDQQYQEQYEKRLETGLQENELISVGEEARAVFSEDDGTVYEETGYTVQSAEFIDSISGYSQDGFFNYAEAEPWLNEDGSLKPYIRQHYDTEGNLLSEEEVQQKLLEVKVKVKKYIHNEDQQDNTTALDATLQRLVKREDGSYTWAQDWYDAVPDQEYYLQSDYRCIYLDQPEFTDDGVRNQFFWRNLEAGDEMEYTLIFAVDEDMKDSIVLDFNGFATDIMNGPKYFSIR